jgi:hypothetical protein
LGASSFVLDEGFDMDEMDADEVMGQVAGGRTCAYCGGRSDQQAFLTRSLAPAGPPDADGKVALREVPPVDFCAKHAQEWRDATWGLGWCGEHYGRTDQFCRHDGKRFDQAAGF